MPESHYSQRRYHTELCSKKATVSFHPYLSFNGNCREAMLFYQSCFGGELAIHLIKDSYDGSAFPIEMHQQVVEAVLSADDIKIFGTDLGLEEQLINGNRVSLLIKAHNSDHLGKLCQSLSCTSGRLTSFVAKGEISNVRDRFGVHWLIYY